MNVMRTTCTGVLKRCVRKKSDNSMFDLYDSTMHILARDFRTEEEARNYAWLIGVTGHCVIKKK